MIFSYRIPFLVLEIDSSPPYRGGLKMTPKAVTLNPAESGMKGIASSSPGGGKPVMKNQIK